MKQKTVIAGRVRFANDLPFVLIAGPCVIENEAVTLKIAETLKKVTSKLRIPLVFKASYDKANRSSINSFRGPGITEGLRILEKAGKEFNVPILTDIHCAHEVSEAACVADILQIPAYLCRQTGLVVAAAKTGKIVNVKKGQFLSPYDMPNIIKKIESAENKNILLTERGASFGYNNLVTDIRSLVIMKETGYPVVFDATHSVQLPGGLGTSSGGQRQFIEPLSRASLSVGIAAVFMECHPNPAKALSDGPNSIPLKDLPELLLKLKMIDEAVK